ncbi:hypothetical protein A7A76_07655 [Lysobacter enzymogenes]|uniref:hypothetical protein n=1 Tax=Lysobacter enzymogenes TaxID=69 RepID=UPI0019D08F4A|nr:hypothetical protein [Lysobacter enzymogenes]MBN7138968.1 hypothetical protein [Lysobacter enzymogenes]
MNALLAPGLMADMFTAAAAPTEIVRNGRTYRLVPKMVNGQPRFSISWIEPGRSGVIGGFYLDERAALEQIGLTEQARVARAAQAGSP